MERTYRHAVLDNDQSSSEFAFKSFISKNQKCIPDDDLDV